MNKPWQLTLVWAGGVTHSQAVSWLKCFLPLEELNLSPHGSLASAALHPWPCPQLPSQTLCAQAGAAACGELVTLWGQPCVFLSSREDSDHAFCPGGLVFGRSWGLFSMEAYLG